MLIRVRDSGSGIAPEELPRLFERFQKGSDSRGSGLGLPIARKLLLARRRVAGIEGERLLGSVDTRKPISTRHA